MTHAYRAHTFACNVDVHISPPQSFLPSAEIQNLPLIKVASTETNCAVGPQDTTAFPLRRFCDVHCLGVVGTVCLSRYSK